MVDLIVAASVVFLVICLALWLTGWRPGRKKQEGATPEPLEPPVESVLTDAFACALGSVAVPVATRAIIRLILAENAPNDDGRAAGGMIMLCGPLVLLVSLCLWLRGLAGLLDYRRLAPEQRGRPKFVAGWLFVVLWLVLVLVALAPILAR